MRPSAIQEFFRNKHNKEFKVPTQPPNTLRCAGKKTLNTRSAHLQLPGPDAKQSDVSFAPFLRMLCGVRGAGQSYFGGTGVTSTILGRWLRGCG